MITQWPLVFFTVFSQLSTGLALFSCWKNYHDTTSSSRGWKTASISAAIALVSSLTAFQGAGSGSMLVAQIAGLILLFCSLTALTSCQFCRAGACIAGCICIISEAVAAIPGDILSPSGIFPLILFPLCTIILGAVFSQLAIMGETEDSPHGRFSLPLRICLWIMLIITAIIPCIIWDDPYMKRSAFAWMQTQLYWMGVIFSGVVIGLSHMGRVTLILQAIAAFASILGLRTAFYADNIHGLLDTSTLYMR